MKIETKFHPGQQVWLMHENKPVTARIKEVVFVATIQETTLSYGVIRENGHFDTEKYSESELAESKEELKNKVFK